MSDMDVMPFRAIQAGYGAELGDGSQRIGLDGGAGRYRAGLEGVTHMVNATYAEFGENYDLLMGFWRKMRRIGGGPFQVDLCIDTHTPRRYTAYFIPGSARPLPMGGGGWSVTFQMEVLSLAEFDNPDLDYWASLVTLLVIYGSMPAAQEILNLLDKLVNEDLPHD